MRMVLVRRMKRPAGYVSVAATCPTLDRIRKVLLAHVRNADTRAYALGLVEKVRADNEQLRANAAAYSWVYHGGEDGAALQEQRNEIERLTRERDEARTIIRAVAATQQACDDYEGNMDGAIRRGDALCAAIAACRIADTKPPRPQEP